MFDNLLGNADACMHACMCLQLSTPMHLPHHLPPVTTITITTTTTTFSHLLREYTKKHLSSTLLPHYARTLANLLDNQ